MENAACHFVFYTGPRKGEAQAFHTARISIGRSTGCDFRLESIQLDQVGSNHAEVLLEEGGVYCLYDLGTRSGTYVNGERVHERCTLMTEDYVRFGQDGPEVIFRIGEPVPGKQPLPQVFPVTAELEFFSGSDAGRIFPVNAAAASNIGRRADLEVPLDPRGDMIVSGNHCNIRYINGHFVLTDSSRNGTYVNGDLVDQPMEILDGDVIMLGDGGPRARFHVDEAKRHYPNHRPLSPVVKKEQEKSRGESAFSRAPGTAGAALGPTMASAAPYSSGGTPLPGQATPAERTPSQDELPFDLEPDVARAQQEIEPAGNDVPPLEQTGHASEFDAESVASEIEVDSTAAAMAAEPGSEPATEAQKQATSTAETRKRKMPSAVPPLHKLNFKPGKNVILGAITIVVLIALIAILSTRDREESGTGGRSDYSQQLEQLVPVSNATGGFNVQVPEGWTSLNRDNIVSAESKDKQLAVDYVRDPALNERQMREILGRNGAKVDATAAERTADGVSVKTLRADAGSVQRVAALHQAGTGAPAMAFLETTEETMEKLDPDAIDALLVNNLALVGPGPAPVATPVAAATQPPQANRALPTPAAATPTPRAVATAPEQTPSATPEQRPTTPGTATTTGASEGRQAPVVSKALNLSVVPPAGWTGVSEEADGMVTLSNGEGLDVRIARDPGELDAKLTFDAMSEEGWNEDGRKTNRPEFKAGEFHKNDQNLMLVLIPEKAKTTIVIYATSEDDFTTQHRHEILDVVQQLSSLGQ